MLALGEEGVADHIKTIGLWRNKAKNVIALSQMIVDEFGGEVPQTRDELTRLPGVGRKTANVVLNEAFGHETIAVDTHIFRVSNRTGLAPGKTPYEVEDQLEYSDPEPLPFSARHWLGAALLEVERYADAERVYREELEDHPHNGWSRLGLVAALDAQGEASTEARADLEASWARADVWIRASRF